ncbi:MAG: hypothetical protein LC118_04240 [Dehalococcoidia bacterium]|nr:hypothetical protein [Dehalococcoidia bacterium]
MRKGLRPWWKSGVVAGLVLIAMVATAPSSAAPPSPLLNLGSTLPITSLGQSGRWFTNHGRPIYFVGADVQSLPCFSKSYIDSKLDALSAAGVNKIRIWGDVWFGEFEVTGSTTTVPCTIDTPSGEIDMQPYYRVGGPGTKFDLTRENPYYWDQMESVIRAAQRRGMVVEVALFDVYQDYQWTTTYPEFNTASPWAYNIQNRYPSIHDFVSGFTGNTPDVYDEQKQYVAKALDRLGGIGNVYFDLWNEFPYTAWYPASSRAEALPWAERVAAFVKSKGRLGVLNVNRPPILPLVLGDTQLLGDLAGLDWHNYGSGANGWANAVSDAWHPAQLTGKIIQTNENPPGGGITDGQGGLDPTRLNYNTQQSWGLLTSGGYPASLISDESFAVMSSAPGSSWMTVFAPRVRALRNTMASVNFACMSPVDAGGNEYDSLINQGPGGKWQVLADPGVQYVAYFWDTGANDAVQITLPRGVYAYAWRDASTDTLRGVGAIVSSGSTVRVRPPTDGWRPEVGVALTVWNPLAVLKEVVTKSCS